METNRCLTASNVQISTLFTQNIDHFPLRQSFASIVCADSTTGVLYLLYITLLTLFLQYCGTHNKSNRRSVYCRGLDFSFFFSFLLSFLTSHGKEWRIHFFLLPAARLLSFSPTRKRIKIHNSCKCDSPERRHQSIILFMNTDSITADRLHKDFHIYSFRFHFFYETHLLRKGFRTKDNEVSCLSPLLSFRLSGHHDLF